MEKYNDFPADLRVEWVAADTETRTFVDGIAIETAELERLTRTNGQKWCREHLSIDTYAWIISDGRHVAIYSSFDEFAVFMVAHRVKAVWFYNAIFDFSQIDYAVLSSDTWTQATGKMTAFSFRSLHSEFGQRYSYEFCVPYKGHGKKSDRHTHLHRFTCYDFKNFLHGGLAKILRDLHVVDFDGKPIAKLTMDYQTGDDFAYMAADVLGLFHAVRLFSDSLYREFGYKLSGIKPDAITAGGLSAKIMLSYLYPGRDARAAKKAFQFFHKSTLSLDTFYRSHDLYRGGLTIINERYKGKSLTSGIYRFDINSMYPFIMSKMPDIVGLPLRMSYDEYKRRDHTGMVYILEISECYGKVKADKIPIWYDRISKEYTSTIHFDSVEYGGTLFIFDFEFNEIKNWYNDIDVDVCAVYELYTRESAGYANFVRAGYTLKERATKEKDGTTRAIAKLLLNSAYGKLSQNPRHIETEFTLIDGAVRMTRTGVEDVATDTILSVVQGAYVTAAARTYWCTLARSICGENVADLLVYGDTDSFHTLCPYDDTDPVTLGKLKDETDGAPFNFCKYLAPKTYFDAHVVDDKVVDIEFHSKGINTAAVDSFFKQGDGYMTPAEIDNGFNYGAHFASLSALNVPGGKVLCSLYKSLNNEIDMEEHYATKL